MVSANYLRSCAERFSLLASKTTDNDVRESLEAVARDFLRRAAGIERRVQLGEFVRMVPAADDYSDDRVDIVRRSYVAW
jgi:hypothetical protein